MELAMDRKVRLRPDELATAAVSSDDFLLYPPFSIIFANRHALKLGVSI